MWRLALLAALLACNCLGQGDAAAPDSAAAAPVGSSYLQQQQPDGDTGAASAPEPPGSSSSAAPERPPSVSRTLAASPAKQPPPAAEQPPPPAAKPPPAKQPPPPSSPPPKASPPPVAKSPPPRASLPPPVARSPPPVARSPPPVTKSPPPVAKSPPPVVSSPPPASPPPASPPPAVTQAASPAAAPIPAFAAATPEAATNSLSQLQGTLSAAPEASEAQPPTSIQSVASLASPTPISTSDLTSVAASIEIQGAGVTPFDGNNQNLVINAFAGALTSVTRADISVRYFTSDSARVPQFDAPGIGGRKLLVAQIAGVQTQATLANTVFVTLQFNAGSNARTGAIINDVRASVQPQPPYDAVPVQQSLQAYGQSGWSVQLLSINTIDPSQPLAVELICNSKFGSFCLDGSGLSPGAVKAIIACGVVFVVLVASICCVLFDLWRRSGQMGELEPQPETPISPMQRAVNSVSNYVAASLAAAKRVTMRRGADNAAAQTPVQGMAPVAGSPMTATVEMAGGKRTVFSSTRPSTMVVVTSGQSEGEPSPATHTPAAHPVAVSEPPSGEPGPSNGPPAGSGLHQV